MALGIVRRKISDLFPSPEARQILEYLRQEVVPVLKELRAAFNAFATGPYDYGTVMSGTGAPTVAPSAGRAIYIQLDGGAGSTLWVYEGLGPGWVPK